MDLHIDLRPIDILTAIAGLEKYLDVMEAQLEEVHRIERHTLQLEQPAVETEEEHDQRLADLTYLDVVYERDLQPAMRYSFVVLTHIVLETQLRYLCSRLQRDRNLPQIALTDLRGSAIDQAQMFLIKLASIHVQDFREWQQLRTLQKVRDCIVHTYRYLAHSRHEKFLRQLAAQGAGISIDEERIVLAKDFCRRQVETLRTLFNRLFLCAGWRT